MPIAYLNGDWVDASTAVIPISDRGLLLGDGVFETARLHRGHYFRLTQHFSRLLASADLLRIPLPGPDELVVIAHELARRNGYQEASFRMVVTRGSGGRGLGRRGAGPPTMLATLSELPADWEARARAGWTVRTSSVRRPATTSVPASLKGLGRSYALLAHFEAEDAGFDDALLLSADGHIAEGPTWNVFWRSAATLYTPAPGVGILEGVTRGLIIELARAHG